MSKQHEQDLADARGQGDLTGVVSLEQAVAAANRAAELAVDIGEDTEIIRHLITVIEFLKAQA